MGKKRVVGRNRTTFVKGGDIPKSPGRPKRNLPPVEGYDFKANCAQLMPLAMKRVQELLENRRTAPAIKMRAADFLADRLYGRPPQAITGAGGGPLLVSFTQILSGVDGARHERLEPARN
jgi:hypothetical protein